MSGEAVVAEARRWLGTPFHHQGRCLGVGVDCAGVVLMTARALGYCPPDFDVAGYGRQPDPAAMRAALRAHLTPSSVADMKVGDVLWMSFLTDPQHLAILTDQGILHAYERAGRCVEHGLDRVWRGRIREVFTWPS